MATKGIFSEGKNHRKASELVCKKTHVAKDDLKLRDELKQQRIYTYLSKTNIPEYPTPVEFHITELAHVTNKTRLPMIRSSGGFRGFGEDSLSWWSLKINEADIDSAQERYLEERLPDRSKEERAAQMPFLKEFTTSPVFLNESSRYGNFRFTFPVKGLMEAYKKQMCDGQEPVLRVYATKAFKQEIEYVVLVHSPESNDRFKDYPLMPSPLVHYDGDQIFWLAQAICETHSCQLEISGNIAEAQRMSSKEFYVWDQVSFAFHIKGVLAFPEEKKGSLSCCELDVKVNLSNGENCSSIEEAEEFLQSLKGDTSEKDDISQNVKMEVD